MDLTRRRVVAAAALSPLLDWVGMAAGAQSGQAAIAGVKLGAQTYSFHDILDDGGDHSAEIVSHMRECGLYSCELFAPQIEPGVFTGTRPAAAVCPKPDIGCGPGQGGSERNGFAWVFQRKTGEALTRARAAQRAFRESPPTGYYERVRRRFADAGIEIYSFNPMFDADCTDAEIDGIFLAAQALGVKAVNASIRLPMLERAIPFAVKHRMILAAHGHSVVSDPEDFSTRKTFIDAFALSDWVWANLDIGHYTAAGEDPLAFINEFHDRISNLHLKDREVEHIGSTTAVGEVQRAKEFCIRALST